MQVGKQGHCILGCLYFITRITYILFFITNSWKAALHMQIREELSNLLFFNYISTPTRLKHSKNKCTQLGRIVEALISDFSYQISYWITLVVQYCNTPNGCRLKRYLEKFVSALRQWTNRITCLEFQLISIFNLCNPISVKNEITS